MMFKSEDKIIFFVHTSKLCELCLFSRLNVLKAVDGQSISDFPFFRFFFVSCSQVGVNVILTDNRFFTKELVLKITQNNLTTLQLVMCFHNSRVKN